MCNRTTDGSLRLQLSGINSPNYQLTTTILNYAAVLYSTPSIPASIFVFNSSTKTKAIFNVRLNVSASGMLLCSLNNSFIPRILNKSNIDSTLLSLLPTTTRTVLVYFQYATPNINVSIEISGLNPNSSYQVALYGLLSNNTYVLLQNLTFWTLAFDPVCQLTFTFNGSISDLDKWAFLQSVSYVLSLPINILTINP